MKILHYYTGITISLFIGLHILNHLMILRSEATHIRFMQAARKIYRNPLVEVLLLAAVLVQVISGLNLVITGWAGARNVFEWIRILSGLYLSLFLVVHVFAVLMGRYKLKMDTNLYYGAGVMNKWPQKLIFIPYYTLSLLAFFFHVAAIHASRMAKYFDAAKAEAQTVVIMLCGIILTTLIIIKMSGLKANPGKPFTKKMAKSRITEIKKPGEAIPQ